MPARGSGLSRSARATAAGFSDRVVSEETRQKISESLHRFYGTMPGEKRKRKYVPHPRVLVDPREQKTARTAARLSIQKTTTARTRKPPSLASQVRRRNKILHTATPTIVGRRLRTRALGVPVTHRRRMTRTAHLISAHHRRRRIGLVHIHRVVRRNRSLIYVRGQRRAHRVWKLKLLMVGGRRV